MTQQIRRFAPDQASKVFGILYTFFGVLVVPFFLVAAMLDNEARSVGIAIAMAMPVIYGVLGMLVGAIGCALYNLVAGWIGGIEFEFEALRDGSR